MISRIAPAHDLVRLQSLPLPRACHQARQLRTCPRIPFLFLLRLECLDTLFLQFRLLLSSSLFAQLPCHGYSDRICTSQSFPSLPSQLFLTPVFSVGEVCGEELSSGHELISHHSPAIICLPARSHELLLWRRRWRRCGW